MEYIYIYKIFDYIIQDCVEGFGLSQMTRQFNTLFPNSQTLEVLIEDDIKGGQNNQMEYLKVKRNLEKILATDTPWDSSVKPI